MYAGKHNVDPEEDHRRCIWWFKMSLSLEIRLVGFAAGRNVALHAPWLLGNTISHGNPIRNINWCYRNQLFATFCQHFKILISTDDQARLFLSVLATTKIWIINWINCDQCTHEIHKSCLRSTSLRNSSDMMHRCFILNALCNPFGILQNTF